MAKANRERNLKISTSDTKYALCIFIDGKVRVRAKIGCRTWKSLHGRFEKKKKHEQVA